MININYSESIIGYKVPKVILVKELLSILFITYGFIKVSLNINIVSDEELLELNIQHLNHDYYTDILTFDYSENNLQIEGELYISLDRIKDNAQLTNIDTNTEMIRVIFHGCLHLVDYTDATKEQKVIMTTQENYWIDRYVSRETSLPDKSIIKKALKNRMSIIKS
jgi:rRNA maturation RNase YbeY